MGGGAGNKDNIDLMTLYVSKYYYYYDKDDDDDSVKSKRSTFIIPRYARQNDASSYLWGTSAAAAPQPRTHKAIPMNDVCARDGDKTLADAVHVWRVPGTGCLIQYLCTHPLLLSLPPLVSMDSEIAGKETKSCRPNNNIIDTVVPAAVSAAVVVEHGMDRNEVSLQSSKVEVHLNGA